MVIKINKSKFNPLYIYILMLIFFGLTFTKTQIFGPLYLHDLVLIIFLVYSITVRPLKTLKFPTILVFIFISIIYLLYSLFFLQLSTELKTMSLRQYMMYFYLCIKKNHFYHYHLRVLLLFLNFYNHDAYQNEKKLFLCFF